MRSFLPNWEIATLAGEQTRLRSKLGGVPWGLPVERWPRCCGYPQKLLAQLCHEPPMLDLGVPGAVLHLFQCLECLGIGDQTNEGAAFVLADSQLGDGLVRVPGDDEELDMGGPLIGEFWLTGWQTDDDAIAPERLPEFFREPTYWALQKEFPALDWYGERQRTRFAGSPRWTGNGPQTLPPPPFEFLCQLDNFLNIPGSSPDPDAVGCNVTELRREGGKPTSSQRRAAPDRRRPNAPWNLVHEQGTTSQRAEYTNFGSDGTAYVFIDRTQALPAVRWWWNR